MSCEHDWETLEFGNHIRQISPCGEIFGPWTFGGTKINREWSSFQLSIRRVCIICGECDDTATQAEVEALEFVRNRQSRRALALKMWEDCKEAK
jgi:hypothetical protein